MGEMGEASCLFRMIHETPSFGATYIPRDYAVVPEYLRGEGDQEIRTVGYVVAVLHRRPKGRTKERDDEANETQSWGGLQDTGGVRRGPR